MSIRSACFPLRPLWRACCLAFALAGAAVAAEPAPTLVLPDGGRLRLIGAAALPAPLRVHARRGGERLHLGGRAHRHQLKHLLQERGVPPWRRAHLPLLVAVSGDDDGQVLAAGDIACAAPLDAWLRARGLRLAWRPPGAA